MLRHGLTLHFILALVAALTGGILEGPSGFFFAGLVAFAMAIVWQQRRELNALGQRVDSLADALTHGPTEAEQSQLAEEAQAPPDADVAPTSMPEQGWTPASDPSTPAEARKPSEIERLARLSGQAIRRFVTTGNPVVRIGVVVLFFGVAFLLRYAWERELVPVELRLASIALAGVALTATGWRLRHRVDTYGLVLQGAGVGILYLTIFSAARLYDLIPLAGAFPLLVLLTAAAAILAVVQNAQALAIFALSGGFLAPVLVSTGAGSHVVLFSYYALLNAGIVAMAWYRHWRWLNWVGFLFTFVIGASWGYRYYRPELFASTEPFLILFFLYYVSVSVLFARRQPVVLTQVVDGTLIFGTPIATFALQWGLVRDLPFGMAFSALSAAVLYMGVAVWLRRKGAFSSLLGQSFLALGVIFATLAIPFAFDNQRWTAATWALEGAGLLWVGIRQSQLLPRLFGMGLQPVAAAAFLSELEPSTSPVFLANSAFMGALLLGIAGLFSGHALAKHTDTLRPFERYGRWLFPFWGVCWWLYAFAREMAGFRPSWYEPYQANNVAEHLFVLCIGLSFALLCEVARRARWREAIASAFLLLPVLAISLAGLDLGWKSVTPLTDLGWAAWPAGFAALYLHLRQIDGFARIAPLWHAGCWYMLAIFLAWTCAAAWPADLADDSPWRTAMWALIPLIFVIGFVRARDQASWPLERYGPSYTGWGAGGMLALLGLWLLATGLHPNDPSPLPYLLLANPVELVGLAVVLTTIYWASNQAPPVRTPALASAGALAFAWVNLTTARAVQFYGAVPYPIDNIVESDAFQTAISILWSAIAMVLMGAGTRRRWRVGWLVGAALLGLVLLKLFTLDLSNLALTARIVSFISVGVLMLVIGYFAPMPPAQREKPS